MNRVLKSIIQKTPLYFPLRNFITRRRKRQELAEWEKRGRPVPPPHLLKEQTLTTYARRFGLRILVETGTYYGDMVAAMIDHFDHIYSIELSEELYRQAMKRFAGHGQVHLLCGNSGRELRGIVEKLDRPALFWLDAHYSGGVTARGPEDSPIYDELSQILGTAEANHVIVIDDARLFGTDPHYPSMQQLTDFVRSRKPDADVAVLDDSIRITPRR